MITVAEILHYLDTLQIPYTFLGNRETRIERFSSLYNYRPGTFTWIKKQESIPDGVDLSNLTLVFVSEDVDAGSAPNVIRTPESKYAFFSTIERFYEQTDDCPKIGQFTYIGPRVKLGTGVKIGHNCTLDGEITIGDYTRIWHNVTIINHVEIGKHCEIQSGVTIGHSSLAYTEDESHHKRFIKHYGGVRIGDYVYLAKNVNVDQGTIDDTVIESGAAIDCKSSVSHNCRVGENTTMAMNCTLGGSTQVGANSYLCRAVTYQQCKIGSHTMVGIGSVVTKDVPDGQTVVGYPARRFLPAKEK